MEWDRREGKSREGGEGCGLPRNNKKRGKRLSPPTYINLESEIKTTNTGERETWGEERERKREV